MDDLYLDSPLTRSRAFTIIVPAGGWRRVFPAQYIRQIKPIAETLAVMSGVAISDYQSFLQEADAVYKLHQDQPDEFSWIKRNQLMQEDPRCRELWNKLQVLLALKGKENGNV